MEKNKIKKNKRSHLLFISLILCWPVLHFIVFWLYVNVDSILLAFQRYDIMSGKYVFYGFGNFRILIQNLGGTPNSHLQYAVLNSFLMFPWGVLVKLPLSLIFGYFLYKKLLFSSFFRVIFFFPSVISVVVLTMAFRFSFDTTYGVANSFLNIIGLGSLIPADTGWFGSPTLAFPMVLVFLLWAGIGYNVVLLTGAIARVPTEILESGKLDGAGMFRELFQLILPLIYPTIVTLVLLQSVTVFTLFMQPMLITEGGPDGMSRTVAYIIVEQVGNFQINEAAATGLFFSAIAILMVQGLNKFFEKFIPSIDY